LHFSVQLRLLTQMTDDSVSHYNCYSNK